MALTSTEGRKAHYKRQFWNFLTQSKYKRIETLIRWHTVDSCLAYSGLMKNGVCQLFLEFAYWVTAFWIRWPDYYHHMLNAPFITVRRWKNCLEWKSAPNQSLLCLFCICLLRCLECTKWSILQMTTLNMHFSWINVSPDHLTCFCYWIFFLNNGSKLLLRSSFIYHTYVLN